MNKVILCGRLTKDPQINYTNSGSSIARFTLAVDRFSKDQKSADFIGCVAFGKNAETIEKFFKKGSKILLDGNIKTGSYENNEGKTVYTTDVWVDRIEFVDSKADGNGGKPAPASEAQMKEFMNIPAGADEEIPF